MASSTAEAKTSAGRRESIPYQFFMMGLCVYTILALAAEVVLQPSGEITALLQYVDTTICAVFLFDFLLCLYRAENRLRYVFTWGWLDLASSIPTIGIARVGRAARVTRILRVLRGLRATKVLGRLVLARRAESAIFAAGLVMLLLLVVAGVSILQMETAPESTIHTAEDALWWALSTMTTVGYGDVYPVTTEGRVIGAVLMCAGVAFFGMFSGLLAAWFVGPQRSERHAIEALREEIRQLREALEGTARND